MALSLRLKIILAFLAVGSVTTALLSWSVYRVMDNGLLRQMQGRVLDLAVIASHLVDTDALARLCSGLAEDLPASAVDAAETSADFASISAVLNEVRGLEERLVHYIYIFAPTADPAKALYVVDADVLADRQTAASGAAVSEEISHYASVFDISSYPVAREALARRTAQVERAWSYDADFHVNSITGYAPLFTRSGQFLGVVGIDMVDSDAREVLSSVTEVMLAILVGALALTLASSILLGTVFTRGIVTLDRVVRTFSSANLAIRAPVRSRDEVGRLSSSFNEMARTIQQYQAQQEALLRAYGRFVPHELLRLLDRGSIVEVKLGDQTEKEMTVLFSDIRSFTRLSESMTPFENFNFLNSYLRRMGPEIRANGGIIDKYIGDAIMALFPGSADDAVAAAVSMHEKLRVYNSHRANSGYPPIAIGIGVNAGRLMLGTVGEHERMDGSVIADTVNLCSRLEALTRLYGSGILTTGRTLRRLTPGRFAVRFVDRVRVRGRRESVLVFEVLDAEPGEVRTRRQSYRSELARAQRLYFHRRFTEARRILDPLAADHPDDTVLGIYRLRCEQLLRAGVPAGWEGIEEIELK